MIFRKCVPCLSGKLFNVNHYSNSMMLTESKFGPKVDCKIVGTKSSFLSPVLCCERFSTIL